MASIVHCCGLSLCQLVPVSRDDDSVNVLATGTQLTPYRSVSLHHTYLTHHTSSSDKMVKELKERLLKAKGNPSFMEGVQDINVLCGVLKDFLRCLREPLLTFRMHAAFMQAAGKETLDHLAPLTQPAPMFDTDSDTDENGLASTLEAIAELPSVNKDTLAFFILHLQKYTGCSN